MTLRKPESEKAYRHHMAKAEQGYCYCCHAQPLIEFDFWRVVPNEFPYDRITKVHHLIILKRHADEDHLTVPEHHELYTVKKEVSNDYDIFFENTAKRKSIPGHFHMHAIRIRRDFEKGATM